MRKFMIPAMVTLVIILIGAGIYSMNKPNNELSYSYFLEAVEEGRIAKVTIDEEGNTFDAFLSDSPDTKYTVPNPKTEDFIEFLLIKDIEISYKSNSLSNAAGVLILAVIAFGIIYYTRNGGTSGITIKMPVKMMKVLG